MPGTEHLVEAGRRLAAGGLVTGTSGNLSMRVGPDVLYALHTVFVLTYLTTQLKLPRNVGLVAVLIASGILGLSGSGGSSHPRLSTILPAVGTGALISSYTVWDAFVVTELAVPALMLVWVADLGRGIVLAPLARRRATDVARIWRTHRREVLGVAILSPLAYVLVLLALRFAPLTYVAPTREVSILIGVVIGRRLLGRSRRRSATRRDDGCDRRHDRCDERLSLTTGVRAVRA